MVGFELATNGLHSLSIASYTTYAIILHNYFTQKFWKLHGCVMADIMQKSRSPKVRNHDGLWLSWCTTWAALVPGGGRPGAPGVTERVQAVECHDSNSVALVFYSVQRGRDNKHFVNLNHIDSSSLFKLHEPWSAAEAGETCSLSLGFVIFFQKLLRVTNHEFSQCE